MKIWKGVLTFSIREAAALFVSSLKGNMMFWYIPPVMNTTLCKKKAASSSQRCTLKPTAGPLMAWMKALIWISLSLCFCIVFFQERCLQITPACFLPSHPTGLLSPLLTYHLLHKPPPQLHRLLSSWRRRSSSFPSFLKLSFKLIHQASWCRAARFSAGAIAIFCMPRTVEPANPPRGQLTINDWKVFVINPCRGVTGAAACSLPLVVVKVWAHTHMHTLRGELCPEC